MEEQKKPEGKPQGKNHGYKHHHRRRGYFIEPPKDGEAQNAPKITDTASNPTEQAPAEKTDKSSGNNAAVQNGANGQGNHQKKKKNRHHKKKPSRPAEQQAPEAQAQQTPDKGQRNDARHDGGKKSDKPKNVPFTAQKSASPTHSTDDYEEYKFFVEDSESADGTHTESVEVERTEVIGVRFKSTGKIYYFDPDGKKYQKGTCAIVDTARGQEFGEVASANSFVRSADIVAPLRKVIRGATDEDVEHHKANKLKEDEAFKICSEKIAAHGLDMKLIEAQYTFDNTKLLFYFTSADRVDFRNLVKDLASVFRTRIELRQIGIRDEAKLMGGLGMCGRPLCCTLFLSDFDQVSIKMAKEQNLSLNSSKISGICGRLMCCIKYEHEAYEYEIKRTPPVGSLVRTENGDGYVTEIQPLRKTVKVSLIASPEVPAKVYNRDEVTMLRKKNQEDKK